MKLASGDENWSHELAHDAKQSFIDYMKTVDLEQARADMAIVAEENAPPDAKKLEASNVTPAVDDLSRSEMD